MIKVIKISFNEIISYTFPLNQFFKLIITSEDKKYNLLLYFRDSDKILCLNKNQLEEKEEKNKNLDKLTQIFKNFSFLIYDCSTTNFNDIQMNGISNENKYNHLKEIKNIIEQISKNRAISKSHILFFGNKDNSFFPMILSVLIRNSKVLIENPLYNLKEDISFKKGINELINNSYYIFKPINEISDTEDSKELLENYDETNIDEIKRDLKKLNENHDKFMDLFNKNYVLKNELLLEKNKLSIELENNKNNLIKTQDENETLKHKINEQEHNLKMINNQVTDIFNAENKLREEVSFLKNQNFELKQELLKKQKENDILNKEISKIKDDELNRLNFIQKGINNV